MSHEDSRQRQRAREQVLFDFLQAYEQKDYETAATIMQLAQHDHILSVLIWDLFSVLLQEDDSLPYSQQQDLEQKSDQVRFLVEHHLLTGQMSLDECVPPPVLTVADIAACVQADALLRQPSAREEHELASGLPILLHVREALPDALTEQAVVLLFQQIGLAEYPLLAKTFRETALFLRAGRQQTLSHLSAARRQKGHPFSPPEREQEQ